MLHTSIKVLLRPAAQALRIYWPPILVIQAFALIVVVCYYKLEATADFFAIIAEVKANGGLIFVAVSTIISGGIVPEILKRIFRPAGVTPSSPGELANQFAMWAGLGILIDQIYQLQSNLFGDGTEFVILLQKVFVDQGLFAPFITQPYIVACFLLHETAYRPANWISVVFSKTMVRRVLTLYATCLTFWPVMLLVIYSLPQGLQFPLFLFANAAYSILMIFIARQQAGTA
ncbi:hypothetical protein G0Q06_09775 [Puniceicoccales bacterium CK1056]|uniref:Uncharacterized protein n=2 Tax=Oceanipulchritudo coccoides TaxID=2706888 RepID=A0A6B2M1D7_9BACT|nr:hypothetical protein [Oceanipulchritudo coccoides]